MKPYNTDKSLRRFQFVGYLSIFVIVGVAGSWSVLTELNSAVIASATIVTESNTKRIQQKDGGVVRQILVKDGDHVNKTQLLVVLDDTETRAEIGIVDSILVENLAKRARLEAQRDDQTSITFPKELLDRGDEPDVAQIMLGQRKLFESRNAAISGKKDQLQQQIGQINEQILGIEAQIASKDEQIRLIEEELVGLRDLLQKGLVSNSRVLAEERDKARLLGERGELVASKAGAGAKIGEVKLQMISIDEDARAQSLTELRDAEGKVSEMLERRMAAQARLDRMEVRSPADGDVYQMSIHTIGGVIQPAETLMLIVPDAEELVLQAQVSPQNIDQVSIGQLAHVRFPAFSSRFTPEVGAEVTQVSADTSRADANSPPFYAVRLRIPAAELAKLDGKKLKPGMPAEAFIQTAAQTPLTYLLRPFLDQIAHTFREK